jgi:putative transposase
MQVLGPLHMTPGERYRYLGEDFQVMEIRDDRAQLRSVSRSGKIIYPTVQRLSQAYLHGNYVKIQDAPFSPDPTKILCTLSDKHQKELRRRITYVQALIKEFGPHLPRDKTIKLAQEISRSLNDTKPPCYTLLYEWVKTYKLHGGMIYCLIPGVQRKRHRRLEKLSEGVQKIIKARIEEDFLCEVPLTKAQTIDHIQGDIYAANKSFGPGEQLLTPSKSTLYRIFSELDFYTVDRAQRGAKIAKAHQKWSKKYQRNLRILEIVEGDSHQMDIFVVDREGRSLGRPWLTTLIDVRTACVIGWDISLNPPSLDKTIRAIQMSLLLDTRFGGLAMIYVLDNGNEFTGERLKVIMENLGATVEFCKINDSDGKPHIESVFKTWTKDIAQHLPGTTYSTPDERGDYDSEGNATLTLANLKYAFQDWLDRYYHKHFHSGVGMAPEESWNEGINDEISIRKFSKDNLYRYFLSLEHVAADNKGHLTVNKVSWTSGAIPFLRRLEPKSEFLCLLYDSSELGHAWAYHPSFPEHPQPLDPVDDYQVGMTMSLHQSILDKLTAKKKEFKYFLARQERAQILDEWRNSKNKRRRIESARAAESFDGDASLAAAPSAYTEHVATSTRHDTARQAPSGPYAVLEVSDDSD